MGSHRILLGLAQQKLDEEKDKQRGNEKKELEIPKNNEEFDYTLLKESSYYRIEQLTDQQFLIL